MAKIEKKIHEIEKTKKVTQKIMKDEKRSHVISIYLLFHTEVRWLSRGKVLSRFIALKTELLIFFQNEGMDDFVKCLKNNDWYTKAAYLADIFNYLNNVNTSIQGRNENYLSSIDKLSGFRKKITLWKN